MMVIRSAWTNEGKGGCDKSQHEIDLGPQIPTPCSYLLPEIPTGVANQLQPYELNVSTVRSCF